MTANPPGECCTTGSKHEGRPQGSLGTIDDIDIYFASPPKPTKKGIIIFTDVFGISQNAQLIADRFASKGYFTAVPDILHKDALKLDDMMSGKVNFGEWLGKHGPETVDHVAEAVINHLKKDHHIEKLAGIGYCFGAKYVVRNLKDGILEAGFSAHPSFVTEEELCAITGPYSIAAAEKDDIFTAELRHQSETILADIEVPYQINLYGSVEHGFALRGDLKDRKVVYAMERAFEQAVNWFDYWL